MCQKTAGGGSRGSVGGAKECNGFRSKKSGTTADNPGNHQSEDDYIADRLIRQQAYRTVAVLSPIGMRMGRGHQKQGNK
jgi:hypothetical protein